MPAQTSPATTSSTAAPETIQLILVGNYAAQVVLNASSMVNIETLKLLAGFNYSLKLNNGKRRRRANPDRHRCNARGRKHVQLRRQREHDGAFIATAGAGADASSAVMATTC